MATKLTQKQENFCLAYVETGNASEAYRRAYNAGKMKPETVNVKASELLKHGKVAERVKDLRHKAEERHAITVDDLLTELDEARQVALGAQTPQASAAVAAIMGKAKLLGFDVSKLEMSGKGGGPIQHEAVGPITEKEQQQIARRLDNEV